MYKTLLRGIPYQDPLSSAFQSLCSCQRHGREPEGSPSPLRFPFFPGAVVGSGLLQGPTHWVKSVFAPLHHFFLHSLFSPSIQPLFHARLIRGSPRSDLRSHFLGGAITTAGVLPHGDTRGLGREHCGGTFVASTAAFDLHAGATSAAWQRAWRGGRAGGGQFGAGGCRWG